MNANDMIKAAKDFRRNDINTDYNFEIYLGRPTSDESFIHSSKDYFKYWCDEEWSKDQLVIDIIKDIDKSTLKGTIIESPVLGTITWDRMSGGAATLILLLHGDLTKRYNLTCCGDNCFKWLSDIVKRGRKFKCALAYYPLEIPDDAFPALVNNNGKIVNSYSELLDIMDDYI